MNRIYLAGALLVCCLVWAGPAHAQPPASGYHILDSLQLGVEGGWDYLTVDTSAERLYVSRGMRVEVVDLVKLSVVGEIEPTRGVHGIALAPKSGRGYVSNGRDSSVTVFDMATLETVVTIKIDARNPDAILYDPFSRRVFTFNGGSANATAIETETNAIAGTVPLTGKPEFAATDGRGHIYVNVEDKSELIVFDPKTLKVLNKWPLAPGEEPSGLAIDRKHGRLFSVCGNHVMVILDADAGKVVSTVPIGEGTDGAAFDPGRALAFSSNGEGTLTVVHAETPEKYTVVENAVTRRGARTMAVDEKTHRIYTVTAKFGPPPPATAERPRPRPSILPGSVKLYVIGR